MNEPVLPRSDELAALRALEELERNPELTQRSLSRSLGLSLGLTNLLIRRMARKAWIKISTMPGRRLMYNLTPRGMAEKARKTRDFLRHSVRYYVDLRRMIADQIRVSRRDKPVVAPHRAGEFAYLVEEAARELGGTFSPDVRRGVDVVVSFVPVSRALRADWARLGVFVVDLA